MTFQATEIMVLLMDEFSDDVLESYIGCTDANALNYDESALCDNGSCVYSDVVVSILEDELSVFETVEEEQSFSIKVGKGNFISISPNQDITITQNDNLSVQFDINNIGNFDDDLFKSLS